VTATYNHFKHLAARATSFNTSGNQTIQYNSIDGMSYDFTSYDGTNPLTYTTVQHGEFGLHSSNGTTNQVNITYSFNTIIYNSDNYGANTSPIAATQDPALDVAGYTVDHNTLIANKLANWRSTNGPTIASGGTGWAAGNVNDVLRVNDGCATNSVIQVTAVTGSAVTGISPLLSGRCATQPTGTKTTTCISGTCLTSGAGLTIAANYSNGSAGYDVTASAGTYGTPFAATTNYLDASGAFGCFSASVSVTLTGNINLTDGSPVNDQVIANCHGHN
jgi:hypothetical protein